MRADAYYNTTGKKCAFTFSFKTGRTFLFEYDGNGFKVINASDFYGHYDHTYNIYGASEMLDFLKMKNDKNLADRLLDYPDAKGFNQLISIEKKELCEEFFGIPMTNMLCHFNSNLPPMKKMLKKMSNGWKTEDDDDDKSDSRLTDSLTDVGLLEDVENLTKQALLQKKNQKKKTGTRKQSSSKTNDKDSNKKRIVKYIGENENGLVKNNFYLLVERIDMFSSHLLVPTKGKVAVENRFLEFSPSKTNSNNSNPSSNKHSIKHTNAVKSDDEKSDDELVEELFNSFDEEVETTTNNAVKKELNNCQDDENKMAEEILDTLHNEGISNEEVKNVLDNYNVLTAMGCGRKFSAQDEELKDILRTYFGMSFKGDKEEDDDDEVMF